MPYTHTRAYASATATHMRTAQMRVFHIHSLILFSKFSAPTIAFLAF